MIARQHFDPGVAEIADDWISYLPDLEGHKSDGNQT